jgi:hypothetical protein
MTSYYKHYKSLKLVKLVCCLLLIFTVVLINACDNKSDKDISFESVLIQTDSGPSENIMFKFKVQNHSAEPLKLNFSNTYDPFAKLSGLYLIAPKLFTGAVQLRPSIGSMDITVNDGELKRMIFKLDTELLKMLLRMERDKASDEDVSAFFKNKNYEVVLISSDINAATLIPKSSQFQAYFLNYDRLDKELLR